MDIKSSLKNAKKELAELKTAKKRIERKISLLEERMNVAKETENYPEYDSARKKFLSVNKGLAVINDKISTEENIIGALQEL